MKARMKWIGIVIVASMLFIFGCKAAKYYTGHANAKPASVVNQRITEAQFLSLQDAANSMLMDKTDFVGPIKVDPLDTAEETARTLGELATMVGFPLGSAIAGGAILAIRTGRRLRNKYEPQIDRLKRDYAEIETVAKEIVTGIKKAKNGGPVAAVTGPKLSEALKTVTSTATKKAIAKLEVEADA